MKNKNKLLTSVLCLLMVVFCIVGLSACNEDTKCSHTWGDWSTKTEATCTEKGVQERKCSECGETETSAIEALGHIWNDATCTTPKTCKTCSETEGTVAAHVYTVEAVKDEALKASATCTSAATYYKSCSCGAISTSDADTFTSGAALEHKDENKDHVCDNSCGNNTIGTCVDENKDHKCDYGCSKAYGTCEDTNKDHKCDYGCGKAYGTHADSATDKDHICDYGCGAIIEACSDVANDGDHSCDVCAKTDVTSCTFGAATCGAPATCSECGATTGVMLPHKDENHDHICDNGCGKNDIGTHADSNTDNDHVCDYGCGIAFGSCSDVDTDNDHSCDVCGKENVTAHVYVENTALATEATCEAAATKTYECNCGEEYTENDGAALGHSITGVTSIEKHVSGCEYVLEYICKRSDCGKTVTGETVYHHNYVASITTPATCKDAGEKTFKCSACSDTSKAAEEIPADATGHSWVSGEVVDGKRTDTCSLCQTTKTVIVSDGNSASSNASDLADADVQLKVDDNTSANIQLGQGVADAIGDKDITISAGVVDEDTLKDMGVSEEQLGQIGANTVYDFNIKDSGGSSVSDFGENYVTITLPYVLSDGEDVDSIAVWFIGDSCQVEDCDKGEGCTDAHKLVSIKATYNNGFVTFQTNHFSVYTVTRLTPAERCALYGHGYSVQHVEGSCTKDSYDLYVCIRCHDRYVDDLVVADGHDYTATTSAATCTENGYILYECDDCDHSYKTKLTATGHAWSVVDSKDATCTEDGYTKYACDNCDGEYTVTSAKVAHTYTSTVIPATCTADGYTAYACDDCGYSYTGAYVEAIGHKYEATTWNWTTDHSAANLTFVCENNDEHVMVMNADVTKVVVEGTCSSFVKTTYTATVSYNEKAYTDQKLVEVGTPSHKFSTEWKSDDSKHWHECVCGEKADVGVHIYENTTVTKAPTCAEAGESTSYCVCGKTKVTVIPATGEHNYVDGFCTVCGVEFVDIYYVNLVNSWKSIDGFAVKIQDFTYEVKTKDNTLLDSFKLLGSIKQIDVAELSLYVEDGKLGGAAIGSIVIFNGPLENANAVYKFKAVIYEDYVYISIEHGKDVANKNIYTKISVDSLIESILEEADVEADVFYVLDFFKDTLIPTIDTFVDLHSEEVNEILEDAFNMIFTFEKQSDGTYVATLDYDKLYELNENLATKPVSEVIDIYFGEGKFDQIVEWILEILDLELSEIPAYLDDHGIDSADLINKINELAVQMGADKDFNIEDVLNDEKYEGVTLGMLAFDVEDDSYIESFNEGVDYLRENSLYEMIDPDSVDDIKESVESILDMISESVSISFTTNRTGMLTSINVDVDDFTYAEGDDEIYVNFSIDIMINGTIEVTWYDIIDEIEAKIVPPAPEMIENEMYFDYDQGYGGYVYYKGTEYYYSNGIRINAYKPLYDNMKYIMITNDCNDWMQYESCYARQNYRFTLATINVDGEVLVLLIDNYSKEVVELVATETGLKAIFEDGTEKEIIVDTSSAVEDIAKFYADVYFAIFEAPEGKIDSFGDYVVYYYNPELEEYSDKTHHDFEYTYEVHGDSCEDGCTEYITCNNCDYTDEYTRHWCDYEYNVAVDLSEYDVCGGNINVDRCAICGHIGDVNAFNPDCNFGDGVEENITDGEGNVIGVKYTKTCAECGLSTVSEQWIEIHTSCSYTQYYATYVYCGESCVLEYVQDNYIEEHEYEYTYELEGESCDEGYKVTRSCLNCGESEHWNSSGCRSESFEIDMSEYGCSGMIYGDKCPVCESINYASIKLDCELEEEETKEIVDDNGVSHKVISMVCKESGLKYVTDIWYEEKSSCVTVEYQAMRLYKEDVLIFEYIDSYRNDHHEYDTTYEMLGEDCEDGYYVYRICTKCGEEENYKNFGHSYDYTEIDLSELGLCGGYIEEQYCRVCDTVLDSYVEDYACWWKHVGDNDDGYSVFECENCGATKLLYTNDSDKDDKCEYTHTEIYIYLVNGEEVCKYELSSKRNSHAYKYEYVLNGETCTDGYTIITTCEDCDIYWTEDGYYHSNQALFNLSDVEASCDNHYIEIWGCVCGYDYYVKFDEYSFTYDEESQTYMCDDCGLSFVYHVDNVEDGCVRIETTTIEIKLADEVLYSYDKEKTYTDHSFIKAEASNADGVICITTVCDKCEYVHDIELQSVEMEAKEGDSYYDYSFTPEETSKYTFLAMSNRYVNVTLYEVVNGKLIEIDYYSGRNVYMTTKLTAGISYVYRVMCYGNYEDTTLSVGIVKSASGDAECSHRQETSFSILLEGSESCEDGVLIGRIYSSCGCVNSFYTEYNHRTVVKDRIDLKANGACCGEFVYYACACGYDFYMYLEDSCYESHTENEHYDDEGRLIHVDVYTCSKCKLRYTKSYYTVKNSETCTMDYYYTVVVNIGSNLVAENQYVISQTSHDYEITGTLLNGEGSSCEDGLIITYKCKDCDDEYSYTYYYHEYFDKEKIDLSELGNVCGGYATVRGCACGRYTEMLLDHSLCDWGTEWCTLWIEDAITEGQYNINGWDSYYSNSYHYICAVTDPAEKACAYNIRFARYWLKDADSCMAYQYETWQFGYNEETGEYEYEVTFKTGDSRMYHNYVDNSVDGSTKLDCPDCGSYYYENYYYDDNGNTTKYEKLVSNTLNNNSDKYYEHIVEYATDADGNSYRSREYSKRIYYNDEEYWYENLRKEQPYTTSFGSDGREVEVSYQSSDGESYSEEYAYVYFKGYSYNIYFYKIDGDYWYRYDYTYTFENGCTQKTVYTNSYGERKENTSDCCKYNDYVNIKDPTCTQDGAYCYKCTVCERQGEVYIAKPTDHNWVNVTDEWHYCFNCGLENTNGVSGDIIMEDLTDSYGNDEYYVVGYYSQNDVEFSQYISLILADGTEVAIFDGIDFIELDGIRAFAFSKAAVEAWATEKGYTDYDVRFSFVPVGSDGSFDYGITFSEPMYATDTIVDSVSFTDYIAADETKSYTITPTEDSVWTFISYTYNYAYATLYDANGNELTWSSGFEINYDLKAGETYVLQVGWYYNTAGNIGLIFTKDAK